MQPEHHRVDQRGCAALAADQRDRRQTRAPSAICAGLPHRGEEYETIREDVARALSTERARPRIRHGVLDGPLNQRLLFGRPHVE